MCNHEWSWKLRSGELWGEPCDMENYNTELIVGKCLKCGETHNPNSLELLQTLEDALQWMVNAGGLEWGAPISKVRSAIAKVKLDYEHH